MCTAITIKSLQEDVYLGRNLDFSHPLDPEIYYISTEYTWRNVLNTHTLYTKHKVLGIGQDISPVVFTEGVNDSGFAVAVLYFPDYVVYDNFIPTNTNAIPIASFELVKYLLTQCSSVQEAIDILHSLQIIGIEDPVTNSIAPLHWIMTDSSNQCVVIEKTEAGLQLFNNPIGVLANSPNFTWHMTNLRNYMNVSPYQNTSATWQDIVLTPFGQGAGTFGLPGDYTSPSRFVRAAYQKTHTFLPADEEEFIVTGFRILETVSVPKGVVIATNQRSDYTQYTAYINVTKQEYYFKTYRNNEISKVTMPDYSTDTIVSLGKINSPITFHERYI